MEWKDVGVRLVRGDDGGGSEYLVLRSLEGCEHIKGSLLLYITLVPFLLVASARRNQAR